MNLIEARKIACQRGERLVAKGLSFSLCAGQILEIGGPNGCGKTTLLRVLSGISPAAEGELLWRGRPIDAAGPEYLSDITYVGHTDGIKSELTVWENTQLAHALLGARGDVLDALRQVGLADIRHRLARYLSAGQRRRLALARLLVGRTLLWLLDEPFTALDRKGIELVAKLIETHASQGGIAVYTSHHPVSVTGADRLELTPMGATS